MIALTPTLALALALALALTLTLTLINQVSIAPQEAVGGAAVGGGSDTSLVLRLSPDVLIAAVSY